MRRRSKRNCSSSRTTTTNLKASISSSAVPNLFCILPQSQWHGPRKIRLNRFLHIRCRRYLSVPHSTFYRTITYLWLVMKSSRDDMIVQLIVGPERALSLHRLMITFSMQTYCYVLKMHRCHWSATVTYVAFSMRSVFVVPYCDLSNVPGPCDVFNSYSLQLIDPLNCH